ncbi:hypothetical protein AWB71_05286 [Caballeronia peredens]|nr:hypothetical protein AWB71_05286 [Caballeronia peredens]
MASKEKHTIRGEIEACLAEKRTLNYTHIAKAVGVSRHRVQKYCKNHHIDIEFLNANLHEAPTLPPPTKPAKPETENTKRRKKKMNLGQTTNVKISLGAPVSVRISLD